MSLDNKVVDLADLKVSHDYLLGQDELLSDRINELGSGIDGIQSQITALGNGSPIPVETVAEMTDNTKAYLYTGSEQGYTSGYWYTYDSTQAKFVPRGEYGAGVIIDSTLTVTGNAADAKATGDAIKAVKTFVVQVPGSAVVLSGSITAGNFAKALAAYTAGSGVYAVKDGEVYQLSAVSSSTMTFTQMYHGTINFIKQIQITSADTFTVTNTVLSSSATDTSYSNTASGLTATNVQAAIDENAAAISNTNGRLTQYDSIVYTEGGGESGQINGQIIQFNSADGIPEAIGVDGSGVTSGNLTVCGVNMHPKHASGSASGLTWTVDNDGVMSFTGTPTADVLIRLRNIYIPTTGLTCGAALFNNMTDSRLSFFAVSSTNTNNKQVNLTTANTSGSFAFYNDVVEFRLRVPKDVDWTGLTIKPMFFVGSTVPTEFIPYSGQTYAVTLGTDGKVAETISYKTGINTIFSDFGPVTAYMPVERRTIKEDFESLSEVVEKGNSLYKYEVSGNGKYLYIAYKSGENWVRWQLHNVPAPNSNSDTWQIGWICGLDENLENLVELVRGGEFELAIREHGAADYCGGNNHGDETTDVFKLFIDGKPITDLSTLPGTYTPFTRIDAFEIATVNRCDTPAEDIVKHQKIWIFEDGKVKVRQTLKFLEQLSVDVAMVCMCAALRSAFPYGIRKGGVAIEDMTTATYTKVYTTATDIFYEYYGDKATCKVHAKTDNPNNTSVMWINNTSDLNKLYYGYFGITNSANPTTVPVNTVITAESEYEVAYTA